VPTDVDVEVMLADQVVHAGRLYSHRRRGNESASFAYDENYLANPESYALDPELPLVSGVQQTPLGLTLFRAFGDSSPDRWGRNLIARNERVRARQRNANPRSLGEFDLLLGGRDDLRQGSIRFRAADGQFLADTHTGVPLLTELPRLLSAADQVADDAADAEALALLVQAGSSLGGARPKAHVLDESGGIAIAKFPSPADDWNVMAWEMTALALAGHAGIDVPKAHLVSIGGRDVLIVERFDRASDGNRIGYSSAMTMLEAGDGDIRSYLDIASVIEERSRSTTAELRQLWRRIAFSVLISNTDDHLRNHAFLHAGGDAWSLSPAFDLNPNPGPGPKHLSTAIDDSDTRANLTTLLAVADMFRLRAPDAVRVLGEVFGATRQWQTVAASHGLSRNSCAAMAPAFEHAESVRAADLLAG
jgi:serine/threonine-protein kinase HipA